MITNTFKRVVIVSIVILSVVACGTKQLVNEAWVKKNPLDWSKQQGIILPIDMHVGATKVVRIAMQGALAVSFALFNMDKKTKMPKWISIQAAIIAPPFNRNLSHTMTWNVRYMADFHKVWDPSKDIHGGKPQPIVALVQQIPNAVTLALGAAEKLIAKKVKGFKINFKPRFLVCAHIDGAGVRTIAGKGMRSLKIKAAMYDAQTNVYIVYMETTTSYPVTGKALVDKGAAIGKMATVGLEIMGKLIAPLGKK